jgi:cell envelope opacity-associated protein A
VGVTHWAEAPCGDLGAASQGYLLDASVATMKEEQRMNNNVPRHFLERLQGKVGKTVDENQLRTLASGVKPGDFEDEGKLRQIIRSLSALSGKTLTEEKEDKIIQMFRNKEINLTDVQSLTKLLK